MRQNFSLPKSDSQQAVQLLQDRFPQQSGDTAQVVFHAREGTLRDPATQARIKTALQKVQGDPHVESVAPPAAGTVSKDARTAYATVSFDKRSFELSTSTIQRVIDDAQSRKIVGVVTDRDLCMNVVAEGRDPGGVTVEHCMTTKVVTCSPNDSVLFASMNRWRAGSMGWRIACR